ncbi:MipA/OmpV family protein [Aliidiomarina sp. Khilg15.8]
MKLRHAGRVLMISSLLLSGSAAAQWTIGAGVISTDASYKGMKSDTFAVPFIGYEGERFYFRGIEAGYRLNDNRYNQLSVVLTAAPFRFKPDESSDPQIAMLDSRGFSAQLALKHQLMTPYGALTSQAGVDVRGNGHSASLSYSYPFSRDPQSWQFAPRIGIDYISSEYTDYYYGISAAESLRSGLPEYSSQDALNPFVGVGGSYRFSERVRAFANFRATRISSKIADSPMADGRYSQSAFLAITYAI